MKAIITLAAFYWLLCAFAAWLFYSLNAPWWLPAIYASGMIILPIEVYFLSKLS